MAERPVLIVYSRRGCHLCEHLIEELLPLARGRARVEVRDVDRRADWRARYGERVPVVECGGRTLCEASLDRDAVQKRLDDPAERQAGAACPERL